MSNLLDPVTYNNTVVARLENTFPKREERYTSVSLFHWNGRKVKIDQEAIDMVKQNPNLHSLYSGTTLFWRRDVSLHTERLEQIQNQKSNRYTLLTLPKELVINILDFAVPDEEYYTYFRGKAEGGIFGPICKQFEMMKKIGRYEAAILQKNPIRIREIIKSCNGDIESLPAIKRHLFKTVAASSHVIDLKNIEPLISKKVSQLLQYFSKIKTVRNFSYIYKPGKYTDPSLPLLSPFVESLIIYTEIKWDHQLIQNIIEKFQNLKKIKLDGRQIGNLTKEIFEKISELLPQLEELQISLISINSDVFDNIYKFKNLRSLSMQCPTKEQLIQIDSLENLETLRLASLSTLVRSDKNYFQNLKKLNNLIVDIYYPEICNSIVLDRLTTLDVFFNSKDQLIEILPKLKNLKILTCNIDDRFFSTLAAKTSFEVLPNLITLNGDNSTSISVNHENSLEGLNRLKQLRTLRIETQIRIAEDYFFDSSIFSKLTTLYFDHIEVSEARLKSIGALSNLRTLGIGLHYTPDTQNIEILFKKFISQLATWPSLEFLRMHNTIIEPEDLDFIIHTFPALEYIHTAYQYKKTPIFQLKQQQKIRK